MAAFRMNIAGVDASLASIEKAKQSILAAADRIVAEEAANYMLLAKRDAPGDMGFLKAQTNYERLGVMHYNVFCRAFYAPYMEFGTKKKYLPIPGTESIAAQFRGRSRAGGSFKDMVLAITEWVKRKGIVARWSVKTRRPRRLNKMEILQAKSVGYAIALSIIREGVRPHPFFFKHREAVEKKIQSRLKAATDGIRV